MGGVFITGNDMTPERYKQAVEQLVDGSPFASTVLQLLVNEHIKNEKQWFNHDIQRFLAINTSHKILQTFPDVITPKKAVELAIELNNEIYHQVILGNRA